MLRAKLLAVTSGMLVTLAVAAVPAFAEFHSNSAATSGASKSGAVVIEGGGASLECTSTEGTWTILNGTSEVTKGSQLKLVLAKWSGCLFKTSIINHVVAITGKCTLDLQAALSIFHPSMTLVADCVFEAKILGTCKVTLPGGQTGLEKNTLENSGENLILTAEDAGITSKVSSDCLGVKETKEAKLKALDTLIGVKAE